MTLPAGLRGINKSPLIDTGIRVVVIQGVRRCGIGLAAAGAVNRSGHAGVHINLTARAGARKLRNTRDNRDIGEVGSGIEAGTPLRSTDRSDGDR